MAPRFSGQTSIFGVVFFISKSLLGIEIQKKLKSYKFDPKASKPCWNVDISNIGYTQPVSRDASPMFDDPNMVC